MITTAKETLYALSLLSGGLDSRLAVCVLREQGIVVHGVCFDSPFFCAESARQAARDLDVPLHVLDFTADIIGLLSKPKHGFGRCMNPCIDCHAVMIRRTGQLMAELGFHVIATGEVLDQRPMSQNRRSLDIVARESGVADRLLRPLSARLLPETQLEKDGRIDRERLLALHGRSRKPQIQLAVAYGLRDWPSPAGGCKLTEPNFCRRLKDLHDHGGLNGRRSLELLCHGRHFRMHDRVKVIVGRNEGDNAVIEGGAELYDLILKVEGYPGPTALLPFTAHESEIAEAAAICARYSDCPRDQNVAVRVRSSREVRRISVRPAEKDAVDDRLI